MVVPKDLHAGLDAVVDGLVGRCRRGPQVLLRFRAEECSIDRLAGTWQHASDRRLRECLADYRRAFRRSEQPKDVEILHGALAAIREAADRELGLRPFPVQLAGALALHRGYLVEMATGEGKTLTAGLAAILAGWSRRPCHIVTVNDYLAQRDAEWLGPLYRCCGVSVGVVLGSMAPAARRDGYAQDITYTTSKELVADFLRDRLALGPWHQASRRHIRQLLQPRQAADQLLVMRGLHTAIVDEADSVLVDEAVTPLIISRQQENRSLQEACRLAREVADRLEPGVHYKARRRSREVELRPAGSAALAALCAALPGIWRGPRRRLELINQALTAKEFYRRDVQYVLADGKVVIVDEFTGRMMPGRTWRDGLHQAVEAKEGLEPTAPSETLARISFQRLFRLFARLSGMTGTAREAAAEFWHIYRLPVVTVPTNRPCQRRVLADQVFPEQEAKWDAVVRTIASLHADQSPVLVGTRSVSASEHLAARLAARGLGYSLLNAVHHREEAQIVAQAGQPGRITIATNMAGRGTDIRLAPGVAAHGGLHVIATERHEAGRIDRQLFGRCGRQGDPGTVHVLLAMDDELVCRYVPEAILRLLASGLRGGLARLS